MKYEELEKLITRLRSIHSETPWRVREPLMDFIVELENLRAAAKRE